MPLNVCFYCQLHFPRILYPRPEVLHVGRIVPRELWSLLAYSEGRSSTEEGYHTISWAQWTGVDAQVTRWDCSLPPIDPV